MGRQTLIRIESDEYDENEIAPFLGSDFTHEIAFGYLFEEKSFLRNAKKISERFSWRFGSTVLALLGAF